MLFSSLNNFVTIILFFIYYFFTSITFKTQSMDSIHGLDPWTQSITLISFFWPFFETLVKFKGLIHYLQNQIYWFFWLPKFSKMRLYRFRISHLFETFKFLKISNFFQIFNSSFFLIFFDFFYDFYCQESYISSYRYNIQN